MDKITLEVALVNQIITYLASRPFSEVYQLIGKIQTAANNQPKDEVKTPGV